MKHFLKEIACYRFNREERNFSIIATDGDEIHDAGIE
jgi:hypothetical protein